MINTTMGMLTVFRWTLTCNQYIAGHSADRFKQLIDKSFLIKNL
jgi:hypothetical protein